MIKHLRSLLMLSTLVGTGLVAQQPHSFSEVACKHEDHNLRLQMTDGYPGALQRIAQDNAALEAFTQQWVSSNGLQERASDYVIPVVFHIIHDNGPENISDAQVFDAIAVMNRDFNKVNADTTNIIPQFKQLAADVSIEFRLAQKDPNGNCTKGINRIESPLTYDGDQDMKNLIIWPRDQYLNIWVCFDAAGAAGYSQYPGSVSGPWGLASDGIVVRYDYTGSIGESTIYRSRTLTHEVGHWLNLAHPWGSTNNPGIASNCTTDDQVNDTPLTSGWTSCNVNGVTCGSLDNVQNFMEYSYCGRMFTMGQGARMLAALNSSVADRNQLHQQFNLIATGTDDGFFGALCEAVMQADVTTTCSGDSILFVDVSYNGVTSRTWTFQGGVPSTSNDSAVWVTFNTPGIYDVSLTVSDGSSSETDQRLSFIEILPGQGLPAPFSEGFETVSSVPNADWEVVDYDNDGGWLLNNASGSNSTSSVRLLNSTSRTGRKDELLSASIDVSNATDISVSFNYAFAKRLSTNDDKLRLYASNDCGRTWYLRRQLRGATTLATGPITPNGTFVPDPNEYGYSNNVSFTQSFFVSDFRIKFEFESDGGNFIYLDNININGQPVGLEEVSGADYSNISVFPNPNSGQATLQVESASAADVVIDLIDPSGRMVKPLYQGSTSPGSNNIDLDLTELSSGFYLIRFTDGRFSKTISFIRE